MTRLNNAISPSDAHAIDVRYQKACWTQHVFHVLRGNRAKLSQTTLPMQLPCLIELINLVDFHNQQGLYTHGCHRDNLHIYAWWQRKHNPTLTRQWMKDKILKSVRQKERRKPFLIYCPEACEEDMVHSSLMQSVTSEMENTMMIYKTAKCYARALHDLLRRKRELTQLQYPGHPH